MHFKQRNIKRPPAKIVNGIKPLCPVIKAIGKRGGGWFIDQTQDFDASQFGGILGRGACTIIKIGRDGNDRLFDRLIKAFFGARTKGTQNIGRYFDRGQNAVTDIKAHHHRTSAIIIGFFGNFNVIGQGARKRFDVFNAAPHQAFDRRDNPTCIGVDMITGGFADHGGIFTVIDNRRHNRIATRFVTQDFRGFIARNCNNRIGGSKIDTDRNLAFVFVGKWRFARFVDL